MQKTLLFSQQILALMKETMRVSGVTQWLEDVLPFLVHGRGG